MYPDRATLEQDIAHGELFVAFSEYGLLGCVVLNTQQEPEYAAVPWQFTDAAVAVIHRLMVHPKAQGKGIAQLLMTFAETRARELGFRAIRLDAFRANPRAQRFYQARQYRLAGEVRFRKGDFDCFEKRLETTTP
jgi:GNAT superfamily N-acetyltransferase